MRMRTGGRLLRYVYPEPSELVIEGQGVIVIEQNSGGNCEALV